MNTDLKVTLALAAHANAALRTRGCDCGFRPKEASPLSKQGPFTADGPTTWNDATAWVEGLKARGARRVWVNVFQGTGESHGWALEIELAKGAEVWISRPQSGAGPVGFERVITQLPVSERTPNLEEAHHRLNVALSEAHRQALEARDAALAAALLEARDCLEGAGPADREHLLPDVGYGSAARALFRGALRVSDIQADIGGVEAVVSQGVLAAVLSAVNSPE